MFEPIETLLAEVMPLEMVAITIIMIKIVSIVGPILLTVAYLTYAERKVIGYIQVRPAANRVGPKGWLQPIADGLKLIMKETIIPTSANRYLFVIAPLITFTSTICALAVVPFDEEMVLADIDASLLYILAITSMGVYGVIVAGWASNSKYALLGALRSAAQIVSYEIAMGFALVGVLIAAQSINIGDIVRAQEGSIIHWFWLPLFPLFIIYFLSGVAETNRAPFDVAEGESEIVAGYHVEYSAMTFGLFMLSEYVAMILICLLSALMFMGGWLSPFQGIPFLEEAFAWVPGIVWLIIKALFFMFMYFWLRATYPRYRYDQIMRLGWKVFIPITIVWLLVAGVLVLADVPPWFD